MKTNGNVPAAMADGATVNLRARVRGNRHRAIDSDSLTRNERDVLDLWDAGVSEGEIAIALELKPSNVARILRTYVETFRELAADSRTRTACDALLRKQLVTGQHDLSATMAEAMKAALGMRAAAAAVGAA